MAHELAQEDRFTCPHFAGNEHETFLGFDAVNERTQTLNIERMAIKKSRIRRDAEGVFVKTKMTLKHCFLFLSFRKFGHLLTLLRRLFLVELGKLHSFPCPIGNTTENSFAINEIVLPMMVRGGATLNFYSQICQAKMAAIKKFFSVARARLFIALWIVWTTIARVSKTLLIHSCGQFFGKPGLFSRHFLPQEIFPGKAQSAMKKNFKRQIICEPVNE